MKRKSAALVLPLFFASSILAVSSFKDDSSLFTGSVNLLSDNYLDNNADSIDNDTSSDEHTTDSDIVIYESEEDKRKLKRQKRKLDAELKTKLTKQLNEEALLALEKQIAEKGRPVSVQDKVQVEVLQASNADELLPTDTQLKQENTEQQLAMLTTSQQLQNQRRALNLAPPIPPGTLGGGNGNGGPGAGQFTASSN